MKTNTQIAVLAVALLLVGSVANAKIRIVASTTDLASIAGLVGGDKVKVESIVRGSSDPHFVDILPSYMIKVSRADIYLKVGADLDFWADQLIDGSQNRKLVILDCSTNVEFLEVPRQVDRSMGDVHVQGNPHYWLDPANGLVIAQTIVGALIDLDPGNAAHYTAGLEEFRRTLELKMDEWDQLAAPIRGAEIISYHNTWPYLSRTFGIVVLGFVEPKPGIEPTPNHTAKLIDLVNERGIKVIGKEPYYSDRAPKTIAGQTNAIIVDLPTSVGGVKEATDYFALFDVLLTRLQPASGS